MIRHTNFENNWSGNKKLWHLIDSGKIVWGGNSRLKIYGTLSCTSGKRMLRNNRVFFTNEQEALLSAFRPCGHCMRPQYFQWKYIQAHNQ